MHKYASSNKGRKYSQIAFTCMYLLWPMAVFVALADAITTPKHNVMWYFPMAQLVNATAILAFKILLAHLHARHATWTTIPVALTSAALCSLSYSI